MLILAINPGSTSTKLAVYDDDKLVHAIDIAHSRDELAPYQRAIDQYDFRKQHILRELETHGIPVAFDAVVMRGQQMDDAQRTKVVLQALRQLGKSYDFNFDIATTDRIVCSELVYVAYTDTHWPTDRALGRFTISPDQIARKLFEDNELQLVLLYLDGQPVNREPVATLQPLIATKRS